MVKLRDKGKGFVTIAVFSLFLIILMAGTAIAGSISFIVRGMLHRNEILQAYSILEEHGEVWKENAFRTLNKDLKSFPYKPTISTQKIGPYILFVKEIRNENTGKVLVNRFEFMSVENIKLFGS